MSERIPNILRSMLYEYEANLKKQFGSKIFGIYLYNSIALGGFDEEKSDIDFITVLNEDFEEKDKVIVNSIHDELIDKYKHAKKMEGMYLTKDKIGKLNPDLEPYLYFYEGKLYPGYFDINYVTWWVLKHNGIPINSPDASSLHINVYWDDVVDTMNYNLNGYWKEKLIENDIFLSDAWIEFGVLTICRIVYTLDKKCITTKMQAAEWAASSMPNEYQLIINEAVRIRNNSSNISFYETTCVREKALKVFMNYAIDTCNKKYNLAVENWITKSNKPIP